MEIYKFGGASVKNAQSIKNVADIIVRRGNDPLVVVVSAMGKTTNALEDLLHACLQNTGKQRECFEQVRVFHLKILEKLLGEDLEVEASDVVALIDDLWLACNELMHHAKYDYHYDQIVSYGELLSSSILGCYLKYIHYPSINVYIPNALITDSNFLEGNVDWEISTPLIQQLFQHRKINCFITQGFIAGNNKGDRVTLGREGSDYTAAILGNMLEAEAVTVWKDVDGILNADPRWYEDAIKLDSISYQEAVELSYYGAQVIHPKSIKPLQNKNIPLLVRSFIHPEKKGTQVTHQESQALPPIYIKKENQALISLVSRDFSFIIEDHLSVLLAFFAEMKLKINLCQISALQFSVCVDQINAKIPILLEMLEDQYKIKYNNGLTLYTIRHPQFDSTAHLLKLHKELFIEQKTRSTIHLVLK